MEKLKPERNCDIEYKDSPQYIFKVENKTLFRKEEYINTSCLCVTLNFTNFGINNIHFTAFNNCHVSSMLILNRNAFSAIHFDSFLQLPFKNNMIRLELSSNEFREIPVNLPRQLQYLKLKNNHITNVTSQSFIGLENLEVLDLSSNQLKDLPSASLNLLSSLTSLYLEENQLQRIPSDLASLSNLNGLNISNNVISIIYAHDFSNSSIMGLGLDISSNGITFVEEEAFTPFADRRLLIHMYNNLLTEIPSNFAKLKKLEVLDLSNNRLTTLNPDIFGDCKLETLILNNNYISAVSANAFSSCQDSLHSLEMSNNLLQNIPTDVSHLKYLTTLDLSKNHITTVQSGDFLNCTFLVTVDLSENRLNSISKVAFLSIPYLLHLGLHSNSLTNLDEMIISNEVMYVLLYNNRLTKVPYFVRFLSNILLLNLSNNYITSLDSGQFLQCYNLDTLVVSNNSIAKISENSLRTLPNLRHIFLHHNLLKEIPHEIGFLRSLRLLVMEFNAIRNIKDDDFRFNANLTQISLNGNLLTGLDSLCFQHTPELKVLQLSFNRISFITDGTLEPLKDHLNYLTLNDNSLETIPPVFKEFSSLIGLNLGSNLLREIDYLMLDYLRKQHVKKNGQEFPVYSVAGNLYENQIFSFVNVFANPIPCCSPTGDQLLR